MNTKTKLKGAAMSLGMIALIMVIVAGAILGGLYLGGYRAEAVSPGSSNDNYQPQDDTNAAYVSFPLSTVTLNVKNALNTGANFGAADVYARVYPHGEDIIWAKTPYLDISQNYNTTSGALSFTGNTIETGKSYDVVVYQGDGGTNLYADKFTITVPKYGGDKTSWSDSTIHYMTTEGSFADAAFTATADAGNLSESTDAVTLDKSDTVIQGCLKWEFTVEGATSGAEIKDPVIVMEESTASPLTDINDIEHIYLSVKSGSGVTVPSGDLKSQFLAGTPIPLTDDGLLGSSDSATLYLQICLPASESDVGTGAFQVSLDDMGDYRARDIDDDLRATAETETFTIQA